jgi:hypothetical protein
VAETIFTGEDIENLSLGSMFPILKHSTQYPLGSLKISSCEKVHATHEVGTANKKSAYILLSIVSTTIGNFHNYHIFKYLHKFNFNRINRNQSNPRFSSKSS